MRDSSPEGFQARGTMEKSKLISKDNVEIAAFVGLD
jgi:hypothetical protein